MAVMVAKVGQGKEAGASRRTIMMTAEAADDDLSRTPGKLAAIRGALGEEYAKRTNDPWIVAYSGGKDSTLLLQLATEAMLALPPEKRKRRLHIVANDTLVESPLVISHLQQSIGKIREMIAARDLPMSATITRPCIDQTFWVNVIGRGYIPPTRSFRWCTDRMKIHPTTRLIRRLTIANRRSVLLVGTRKSESASRRRRMEKREKKGSRFNPHSQIENCRMFSPLADLTDNEVWAILMQSRPPWGGTHRELITLYRNARGGECPVVLSKDDAPSCGSTSPRFGCWTCTVVKKDRSLEGLVSSGFDEFEPLMDFRNWLLDLREDDNNRMPFRRDGATKQREDGSQVRGPFKMKIRQAILRRLLKLEKEIGKPLIRTNERLAIEDIWRRDTCFYDCRASLLQSVGAVAAA